MRKRARLLRTEQTDAEKVIWRELRGHRLNGVSFRRQTPIGPYIVDFVSHRARLVIEIDGGQHFDDSRLHKDLRRNRYLESRGFRVLRFANNDVLRNCAGVLSVISAALKTAPSLPSPASGGGNDSGKSAP